MARAVSAGGFPKLAYFRVGSRTGFGKRPRRRPCRCTWRSSTRTGASCTQSGSVPVDFGRMFAEHISLSGERGAAVRPLSWQGGGEEWHGVLTHLPLVNERITAVPWAVVAFSRDAAILRALGVDLEDLAGRARRSPCSARGSGSSTSRVDTANPCSSCERACRRCRCERFEPIEPCGADEPRAADRGVQSLRRAACTSSSRRWRPWARSTSSCSDRRSWSKCWTRFSPVCRR